MASQVVVHGAGATVRQALVVLVGADGVGVTGDFDPQQRVLAEDRDRLVEDRNGIDAARLSGPNGYGESRPLEQLGDDFPGCKSEKNRRTELNVQN